jgi:hypothetical protein
VIFVSLFIMSMMLTPLAIAKPGAEKNNDKFNFFQLMCSGTQDETTGTVSETYIGDIVKTRHVRDRGWLPDAVLELTVGEETFTMDTKPFSVDWTTTFDANAIFNNDGTSKQTALKLTDVVTVYDEDEVIGTLVLKIVSVIAFTDGAPSGYSGTVVGYGTDSLKAVRISAIDLGLVSIPPPTFERLGTITGWPEQITNIIS